MCIASRATRWPGTLIEEADKLLKSWTIRYGAIEDVGITLYEEGGRLHGISSAEDLSQEVLAIKWLRAPDSKTRTGFTYRHGDLGFKPGE